MGWGRGGRGAGRGGQRLSVSRPVSPRPSSPASHYFEDATDGPAPAHDDSTGEPAKLKQLEKKLQDIQALEERLLRGDKLGMGQIKKVESKAAVEQELEVLRRGSAQGKQEEEDVDAQLAELLKEKAELENEDSEAGSAFALPHAVPEAASPKKASAPPPRSPTRLAPWSRPEASRSRSPAVHAAVPETTSSSTLRPEKLPVPSSPTRSRAGSPKKEEEVRLPIPATAKDWQLRQLTDDLWYWGEKFACTARVDNMAVVAQIRPEAQAGDARSELFALVEYDLELDQGTFSRGIVAISGTGKAANPSSVNEDISDANVVFNCCDADGSGSLDVHELKFALNAFGLFPSVDCIRAWLDGRDSLKPAAFAALLDQKMRSAPTSMRRPRAIPYARRGVSLLQLTNLHETFISSGWLQSKCAAFNDVNATDIRSGKLFAMDTNLYALNRWVVMPGTSPYSEEPLPVDLRRSAGMPEAAHESSYSELMNPGGLPVDYFVSHFWGHPFQDTFEALRVWSSLVHWQIGKEPEAMVYWICLLALNQHQPGEEVGSSPEEGPFNAALMQSSCGAVMVVDEEVSPFSRIWCLFEVKRLTDLKKDFHLISSCGAMGSNLQMVGDNDERQLLLSFATRVADALANVSAFQARSSSEDDKFAIWHRVADPHMRRVPLAIARDKRLFTANTFKRFDTTIRSLLAAPLFQTSLGEQDMSSALRYIGLGAPFGEKELQLLNDEGVDVTREQVKVQSGTSAVSWHLLHCAAYFGHVEAVESLVSRNAKLEVKTSFGLTPLHQAARNGHAHICEQLLNFKANINALTRDSRSAVQNAAHQGHREVVELLAKRGADVNHKDGRGISALHSSSVAGYDDIVKVLIAFRANCLARDGEDMTPLHIAARSGFMEVAKEVIGSSPDRHARRDLAAALSKKGSALDLAATHEMADFLRSITEDTS